MNQDKKKIFEKIHKHSGRKNIERAIERGIKIEEINENSLLEYNDMINEKRKLLGKEESPYDIRYDYWKTMKQIGYIGLIAKKKNVPVGALFFNHFNKYIIESGLVRSDLDYEEKLYSQDLIKWKIIEWGIDNKMNWYDFAGANPNPSNSKEEGILRYKRKWGGKQYDYMLIQNYN
ncbi:MAG: hypothetical protein ACE5RN_04905 [Nitrosopumilaceae archaeon]